MHVEDHLRARFVALGLSRTTSQAPVAAPASSAAAVPSSPRVRRASPCEANSVQREQRPRRLELHAKGLFGARLQVVLSHFQSLSGLEMAISLLFAMS